MANYKRIDAHHHFWNYKPELFPWITPERMVVGRDFLPDEFEQVLRDADIDASVAVHNFRSLEETDQFLAYAKQYSFIKGVVGWFPLVDPELKGILERYAKHPLIKGAREIMQFPDVAPYFSNPAFDAGLDLVSKYNLTFDLLIGPHQMKESIQLVDAHPELEIVLSHLGKPPIASGEIKEWSADFSEIAKRPNVVCKLSGLPLEAKLPNWTDADLKPCIDLALECFGPDRLMFGSDWPPCLMATTYGRWVEVVEKAVAQLSESEQSAIWAGTAESVYQL